jgi:hypothetical protein
VDKSFHAGAPRRLNNRPGTVCIYLHKSCRINRLYGTCHMHHHFRPAYQLVQSLAVVQCPLNHIGRVWKFLAQPGSVANQGPDIMASGRKLAHQV